MDYILTGRMLPELSRAFLARLAEGQPIGRVRVGLNEAHQFAYTIE